MPVKTPTKSFMRPLSAPEMSGDPVLTEVPTPTPLKSKLFSVKFGASVAPPSADLFGLASHRYLRLSENNVRTLLKLCKHAGMNVDIHPHMLEGEIDAAKMFSQNVSVAL